MYLTKEQLESKWWHRLAKVLRLVLTIGFLAFTVWASFADACNISDCNINLLSLELSFSIISSIIIYYGFWFIYRKIILYIVFGKEKNK